MDVKKIFLTLIGIVACVILGAFLLNTLLPNVTAQLINAVEDAVYKATHMSFDFNGDNNYGGNENTYDGDSDDQGYITDGAGVDGFN